MKDQCPVCGEAFKQTSYTEGGAEYRFDNPLLVESHYYYHQLELMAEQKAQKQAIAKERNKLAELADYDD